MKLLGIRTPSAEPGSATAVGRQSAEGGGRQVAGARLRRPVLRRADAGHRRRRQEPRSTSCCNELADQGKAIVMISSELPEILRMSDRIVVMCEGRITGELMPAEATQEEVMQLATQRENNGGLKPWQPNTAIPSRARGRGGQRAREQAPDSTASSGRRRSRSCSRSRASSCCSSSSASPRPNFAQIDNLVAILHATAVNGVLGVARPSSSSPPASTFRSAR